MDIIRMGTEFRSKKIGHRTVQVLSESNDSNVSGVGGEDYLSYKVTLPPLWNSTYLVVIKEQMIY